MSEEIKMEACVGVLGPFISPGKLLVGALERSISNRRQIALSKQTSVRVITFGRWRGRHNRKGELIGK